MATPTTGGVEVFTKTITLRNGKVLHAAQVGLTCFRFIAKEKKPRQKK